MKYIYKAPHLLSSSNQAESVGWSRTQCVEESSGANVLQVKGGHNESRSFGQTWGTQVPPKADIHNRVWRGDSNGELFLAHELTLWPFYCLEIALRIISANLRLGYILSWSQFLQTVLLSICDLIGRIISFEPSSRSLTHAGARAHTQTHRRTHSRWTCRISHKVTERKRG